MIPSGNSLMVTQGRNGTGGQPVKRDPGMGRGANSLRRLSMCGLAHGAIPSGDGLFKFGCAGRRGSRHVRQIDVKSRAMRKFIWAVNAEASVAPGPGTANQSTEGVMEISLSQEQIESLIEKSMPDIKKAVVENVASRMTWSISDTLAQQVKEFVTEWVKENVLPDIATHLITNKDMLVGVAVESAPKIAVLISEAMAESIKKTLENSYGRGKLFDALLKS